MKVRIKPRPLDVLGAAECRCCTRLSWKNLKSDRQTFKEAVNDVDYALAQRKAS